MSHALAHSLIASARALRLAAVGLVLATGTLAQAQTFVSSGPIAILDNAPANPYPSTIQVSGVVGTVQHVALRFNGFTHTYPSDVVLLLVAPSGQSVVLMSRCGGSASVNNATFVFTDSALTTMPSPIVAGAYRPSNCSYMAMPSPAPAGPYGQDLGDFQGTNVNGTWSLYACDFAIDDVGSIGSWSISFDTSTPAPSETAFTYQGIVTQNGAPVTGDATARFQLFDQQTGGVRVGPPLLRTINANNGLLTTWLDFGSAPLSASSPRWLEATINGEIQSPRQRLMNAPTASKALVAETASSVPWANVTGVPASVASAFSPWVSLDEGIGYLSGKVVIGPTITQSTLTLSSPGYRNSLFTSANVAGTWLTLQNTTASKVWTAVATGSSTAGGPNDFIIGSGPFEYDPTFPAVRILGSNGYVGIGMSYTTLPSQRLTVNGNVLANNVAVPSSIRFKDHVVPMNDALTKLLKLEGVRFDWKPEWAKERPGREHDIGFVAEDVAKEFPEVVFYDADGNVTGMDYSRMTAVAIEAIKQQQAQLLAQQRAFDAELAKRDAENAELRARLDRLEKSLAQPR